VRSFSWIIAAVAVLALYGCDGTDDSTPDRQDPTAAIIHEKERTP
jgi:hypothetical protein